MKNLLFVLFFCSPYLLFGQQTTKLPAEKATLKILPKFARIDLIQDFDILRNAFFETHVGLWYNTYAQFDSLCLAQRARSKTR